MSRLVVLVFQLEGLLATAGDQIAGPIGQSTARWRILAAVEREPSTVAQIARDWRLARQSVQRVSDALEADGLVIYVENPSHRRAKLVQLTAKGRRILQRIQQKQVAWANDTAAALDARDLAAATKILSRILATIERE